MTTLEPIVVLMLAYCSYLLADMLEWSGILSIVMAGFTARQFIEANMSEESVTTLHNLAHMLANVAEMMIFLTLGIVAAISNWSRYFMPKFTLWVLFFCSVFRPLIVVFLTTILNYRRPNKISWYDMFIMSFSGLRGGIAFSLMALSTAVSSHISEDAKMSFLMTTIFIVFFTSFVQGIGCGPLVNLLGIAREVKQGKDDEMLMLVTIDKLMHNLTDGVVAILGQIGVSNYTAVNKFEDFQRDKIAPYFLRNAPKNKEAMDAHEITELWYKETQQDYQAMTARAMEKESDSDSKSHRKRAKDRTIDHKMLVNQLTNTGLVGDFERIFGDFGRSSFGHQNSSKILFLACCA